jgi:dTDP-4-dehydrorhamnose reductase
VRILLLGKHGQLGWELQRTLAPLGALTAVDFEDLDLAKPDLLRQKVRELRPETIVNAAAYTDVDKAESESDKALSINSTAPQILAEECKALGSLLVHFSTDYVFDGSKGKPYTEDDPPNPLNVYGVSKLAGERAVQAVDGLHLVLRTAWVYSLRGSGFVTKVLKWVRQHETLRIVDDQISNPTWARMLAEITAQLLSRGVDPLREHRGLYHLAGSGYTSRFEWAQEILKLDPRSEDLKAKEVLRASTFEIPTPARRPTMSALDCQRFVDVFGLRLPQWKDALRLAMEPS